VPITEVMMELVKADAGVAVVHRWVAEPQLRSGAVVALRLTRGGLWKSWQAVYARTTPHRDALRDLVAQVRDARIASGQRRTRRLSGIAAAASR
jgi:DNA-binding transcriptional LysR family regulator